LVRACSSDLISSITSRGDFWIVGKSAFAGLSRVGSEMVMSAEEARTPRNVTPMQSVRNVRTLQAA